MEAFCRAASNGNNAGVIAYLDKYGPDFIDAKNKSGWGAFTLAAAMGHTDTVVLLLERGAEINKKDHEGKTAQMRAHESQNFEIKVLLEQWPELQQQRQEQQERAAMVAAAEALSTTCLQKLKQLRPSRPTLKKGM